MPTKERRTYRLITARQKFKARRGYRCHYSARHPKSVPDRRNFDVQHARDGYQFRPQ